MTDATYTEMLESVKQNAVKDVRVCMPARIISFDSATKTAEVEIMIKMQDEDGNAVDYPPLQDCPCIFTRGGGFHVTHPYSAGDNGIVIFSDRCIDAWFQSGVSAVPMDFRIHSMSDAFFIGGADNLTDVSPIADGMFIGKDDNSAGVEIKSSGELHFYGKSIFHGEVEMQKTLTVSGLMRALADAIINGISFSSHKHGNVQSGSSDTGVAK